MSDVRSHPADDFPSARPLDHEGAQLVSACIPARDEEATVATIVEVTREHLAGPATPLVNEILVIDARRTAAVARWRPEWSHVLERPDPAPIEARVDERPPLDTVAAHRDGRAALRA